MAPGRARRAARGPYRGVLVLKGLIAVSVLCGFLYHTNLNLQRYLEGKTVYITSGESSQPAMFPPFRFCIWPTWNPLRLIPLGVNIFNLTKEETEENYYNLIGIAENVTGRQLVEHAAWRVEDLIEEVRVGNIHEVYDPSTHVTSKLWGRSFTPLGPCLTLTPPTSASLHDQNLSIKVRDLPAVIEPCRWEEKGHVRQYRGPEDCRAARNHCNTSCEWQDFVKESVFVTFGYLLSTSDVYWINELKTASRIFTNQFFIVEPFKVLHLKEDGPVDAESCYHECIMAFGLQKTKCKALAKESLDELISSLCVTVLQTYELSKYYIAASYKSDVCLDKCKTTREMLKWTYSPDNAPAPVEYNIRLRLVKPSTLVLRETELYPISQFLVDTGGGLGLFLGVCALDGWSFVVRVVVSRVVMAKEAASRTLQHFGQLAGTLVVSAWACVHLLIMGQSFLQEPVMLSASLTLAAHDANPAAPPVTPETLLMERMASRVFGCRVSSSSRQDECVKCVLQRAAGQSLPFVSVDDLPRCMAEHLTWPRFTFTVQKKYIENIVSKETTSSCSTCDYNISRPPDSINYQILENSRFSLSNTFCTLGGLLGLYLGLSVINIRALIPKSLATRCPDGNGRCRSVAWLGFNGGVFAIAVVICFLQLRTFLSSHPLYSSTSTHSLQEGVLPSVTTCIWPPFNIQRLMELAGLGATFANLSRITDPEARDAATALLLQDLPEAANATDPRILWDAAAWMENEIYVSVTLIRSVNTMPLPKHRLNGTILDHCWSHTPSASFFSSLLNMEYLVDIRTFSQYIGMYSYIISYLHYPDEVPFFEPNVFTDMRTEMIDISAMTRWRALDVQGVGDRGDCLSRCLEATLATHLGCRLPSAVDHQDFDSCNMTVFANFLTTVWRLRSRPRGIYHNLVGKNQTDECHAACRHGSKTFFKFKSRIDKTENVVHGLSVGITSSETRFFLQYKFQTSVYERTSVHDGYTMSTLLSDFGGVVGMTLGVSLLSLLLTFITKMTESCHTHTRVSNAFSH